MDCILKWNPPSVWWDTSVYRDKKLNKRYGRCACGKKWSFLPTVLETLFSKFWFRQSTKYMWGWVLHLQKVHCKCASLACTPVTEPEIPKIRNRTYIFNRSRTNSKKKNLQHRQATETWTQKQKLCPTWNIPAFSKCLSLLQAFECVHWEQRMHLSSSHHHGLFYHASGENILFLSLLPVSRALVLWLQGTHTLTFCWLSTRSRTVRTFTSLGKLCLACHFSWSWGSE